MIPSVDRERLKELLDREVARRDNSDELSYDRPDPLLIASRHADERVALVCALFAYGNALQIVGFLEKLDFSLLESSEDRIEKTCRGLYYRFQNEKDIAALLIALRRLSFEDSLENIFKSAYKPGSDIRPALWSIIGKIRSLNPYRSRGYDFLTGRIPSVPDRSGPFKRYMMYFRWMIRKNRLDMGLWSGVDPADLIIPLDTHTHKVSLSLGLMKRKSYDMKAAMELTENLKSFDPADPLKYDFALYRIGQERIVIDRQ